MTSLSTQFNNLNLSAVSPKWMWGDDHDNFHFYDSSISQAIAKAIQQREPIIRFNFGDTTYEINALTMLQTNYGTGFTRPILCVQGSPTRWQWKDDDDEWKEYLPEISDGIAAALRLAHREYDFTIHGTAYTVAIFQFHQTNTQSSFVREVRQVIALPTTAAPLPPTVPVPDDKLCGICMERAVDTMFYPCGHKACRMCASRLVGREMLCPWCRNPIRRRVVLDFSNNYN